MKTLYTISKCKRKTGLEIYEKSHGSHDAETTLCGISLNEDWYITNNTYDGIITCNKCLKILKIELEEIRERNNSVD